jgi:hypothetical protein
MKICKLCHAPINTRSPHDYCANCLATSEVVIPLADFLKLKESLAQAKSQLEYMEKVNSRNNMSVVDRISDREINFLRKAAGLPHDPCLTCAQYKGEGIDCGSNC